MNEQEAKYAVRVAKEIYRCGGDDLAVQIAFCAVEAECDWYLYPNRRVPESFEYPYDKANPNYASEQTQLSVGLFQQQVQFWGGVARCMGVESSTRSFYLGIPEIGTPGLTSFDYRGREYRETPWRAIQRVQGSQFSDASNYREDWKSAVRLFQEVKQIIEGEDMTYKDFGAAIDGERVPYGVAEFDDPKSPNETVRRNWWSTNRAAYAIKSYFEKTEEEGGFLHRIGRIHSWFDGTKRFVYENQPGVDDDKKGTNSFEQMFIATNGQVYRNGTVIGQILRTQNLHTAYIQQIAEKLGVTLVDPNKK